MDRDAHRDAPPGAGGPGMPYGVANEFGDKEKGVVTTGVTDGFQEIADMTPCDRDGDGLSWKGHLSEHPQCLHAVITFPIRPKAVRM